MSAPSPQSLFNTKIDRVVELLKHPNFYWGQNGCQNLKYLELRIDTRDNMCVVCDRDGQPVDIEFVFRQLKSGFVPNMNQNT